ncbi:unnamed protein product, partial [Porites lobata]
GLLACLFCTPVKADKGKEADSTKDQTQDGGSHKLECTSEETQKVGCLHGGSCFAVEIAGARHTACHCTAEFTGKRCQYQAVDPELLSSGH